MLAILGTVNAVAGITEMFLYHNIMTTTLRSCESAHSDDNGHPFRLKVPTCSVVQPE